MFSRSPWLKQFTNHRVGCFVPTILLAATNPRFTVTTFPVSMFLHTVVRWLLSMVTQFHDQPSFFSGRSHLGLADGSSIWGLDVARNRCTLSASVVGLGKCRCCCWTACLSVRTRLSSLVFSAMEVCWHRWQKVPSQPLQHQRCPQSVFSYWRRWLPVRWRGRSKFPKFFRSSFQSMLFSLKRVRASRICSSMSKSSSFILASFSVSEIGLHLLCVIFKTFVGDLYQYKGFYIQFAYVSITHFSRFFFRLQPTDWLQPTVD